MVGSQLLCSCWIFRMHKLDVSKLSVSSIIRWPIIVLDKVWGSTHNSTPSLSRQHWYRTLRKISIWLSKNWQKLDILFKKIDKNCLFFQKKKSSFLFFFAIFWHSNGNFPEGQVNREVRLGESCTSFRYG